MSPHKQVMALYDKFRGCMIACLLKSSILSVLSLRSRRFYTVHAHVEDHRSSRKIYKLSPSLFLAEQSVHVFVVCFRKHMLRFDLKSQSAKNRKPLAKGYHLLSSTSINGALRNCQTVVTYPLLLFQLYTYTDWNVIS